MNTDFLNKFTTLERRSFEAQYNRLLTAICNVCTVAADKGELTATLKITKDNYKIFFNKKSCNTADILNSIPTDLYSVTSFMKRYYNIRTDFYKEIDESGESCIVVLLSWFGQGVTPKPTQYKLVPEPV